MRKSVQSVISNLKSNLSLANLSLRDKAIASYHHKVVSELRDIISSTVDEDALLANLESYLAENWQLVKGSLLSYSALPQSDITKALCEIAQAVADYKNSKKQSEQGLDILAIELLIPGIEVDTYAEGYQGLDEFKVPELFASHILSAGQDSLIPVSIMLDDKERRPYASSELDEKKSLYIMLVNNEIPKLSRRLESGCNSMGEPLTEEKLTEIKQKLEESQQQAKELQLALRLAEQSERIRLINHSPETLAIYNAQNDLERAKSDNSHLLGHLTELCKQLKLYDAAGAGEEENAGNGAYPAIIAFNEYYHTLDEGEKSKIPAGLRNEISKLLSLSSDKSQNMNATETIETCIASRRAGLERAIHGNESALAAVACSDETKQKLINEKETALALAKEALKKGKYQGSDKLPLTQEVVDRLKIDLSISSLADFNDFMSLEVEEIRTIGQKEEVKNALTYILKSVEELVIFTHETSIEKLQAFLELTEPNALAALCEDVADGTALLSSLENEKLIVMFQALLQNEQLDFAVVDLINCKLDDLCELQKMISSIPLEQRLGIMKVEGRYGDTVFDNAIDKPELLKVILNLLPAEVRLEVLKESASYGQTALERAVHNSELLIAILNLLPPEFRLEVLNERDAYGETVLHRSVNNSEFMTVVLNLLPPEFRLEVLKEKNAYGDTVLHQAANNLELMTGILNLLLSEQRLEAVKERDVDNRIIFHQLVDNLGGSLHVILNLLPAEQRLELLKEAGIYGYSILDRAIATPQLFKAVLELLPIEQRLEAVKERDAYDRTILHNATDEPELFEFFLNLYPEEERLEALKARDTSGSTVFHSAVNNPELFKAILGLYPVEERFKVMLVQDSRGNTVLEQAIYNPGLFKSILDLLPEGQHLEMLKTKNSRGNTVLHQAINNPELFKFILGLFPQDQHLDMLKTKDRRGNTVLHKTMDNPELFKSILALHSLDERLDMLKAKDSRGNTVLQQAVNNPELFKFILGLLPDEHRFEAVKDKSEVGKTALHHVSNRPKLFKAILELLPQSQRLEAIKQRDRGGSPVLHQVTQNSETFKIMLDCLPCEQHLEAIKVKNSDDTIALCEATDNPDVFKIILGLYPIEERLEAVKEKDDYEKSLLHYAANSPELFKIILDLYPIEERLGAAKAEDEY